MFAFLEEHRFLWDKNDSKRYKNDKDRRQWYWQKLADQLDINCKYDFLVLLAGRVNFNKVNKM